MNFLTSLTIKKNFQVISSRKIWKISEKNDIANQFNTFFANKGSDFLRKIPEDKDRNIILDRTNLIFF